MIFSCDGGTQDRLRPILVPSANNGTQCPHLRESQPCNTQTCGAPRLPLASPRVMTFYIEVGATPVDCQVAVWSIWTGAYLYVSRNITDSFSVCSSNCGGGEQSRSRDVLVPRANGGMECPALYEARVCDSVMCNGMLLAAFCRITNIYLLLI